MKAAQIMFGYAGVLILGGVIAFSIAAVGGAIRVSALIPVAMGLIVIAFGVMAGMYDRNRKLGMIGIHVGLVLPLLYGAMFAFLAYGRGTADEPVIYLVSIFVVLTIASIAALALLVAARPKPEERK